MVGLAEVDDLYEKVLADHDIVAGEVHVHHQLLFKEGERVGEVDKDVHLGVHGENRAMEGAVLREGESGPQVVHQQILSIFEAFLRAIVVLEDEGRGGRAKVLHNDLLMLDLLVIRLRFVHLYCYYLRKVRNFFLIPAVKVVCPAFLLGAVPTQIRHIQYKILRFGISYLHFSDL